MAKKKKASSSGKPEATGSNYENRVGAWFCVRLLLGTAGQPLFDLPTTCQITSIGCQTAAAVDDVNAQTSQGGFLYCQAKRTVHLSEAPGAALVGALDQFVRQYMESSDRSSKFAPRPLDPDKDRLILATRRAGSKKVIEHLDRLLRGVRQDSSARALVDVQTSEAEKEVAETVDGILRSSWTAAYGSPPSPDQLGALLRLIWVLPLDVEDGQTETIGALDSLRSSILTDPAKAAAAFAMLIKACGTLRADRASIDAPNLQNLLVRDGVGLRAHPSYRADVEGLQKWTTARLQRDHRYTRLVEDRPKTAIKRDVLPKLRAAAARGDFMLVGDPGSGKSGLTYALADYFISKGRDVVFLPVEYLNATRLSDVWTELRVQHPLAEILQNWPGTEGGLVVVDALDAAKSPEVQTIIREIIDSIMAISGRRWNVVASVRTYDVKQGAKWKATFRGRPPIAEHTDPSLLATKHVQVKALSADEIAQTANSLPELNALYSAASAPLKQLLHNIFRSMSRR